MSENTMVQSVMDELLPKVEAEVPVSEAKVQKRRVKFYMLLTNPETNGQYYVKWVTYEDRAIVLTRLGRAVGFVCGFNHDWRGETLSTKPQVAKAHRDLMGKVQQFIG